MANIPFNEKSPKEIKEKYFIISYQRKKRERDNFKFTKYETKPEVVFVEETGINGGCLYQKVIKFKKKFKEKEEIKIQFKIEEDHYKITFQEEEQFFYFDVELQKENKYMINLSNDHIKQDSLDYLQKLDLFMEALKINKEEAKIDDLYEEAIVLYSKKNEFDLMMSLFVKIYDNKYLCGKLMEAFYDNIKNENNIDAKPGLDRYIDIFNLFKYSNSSKFRTNNSNM